MLNAVEARALANSHRGATAEVVLKDQLACIKSAATKGLMQCPVISRYGEMENPERERFLTCMENLGFVLEFRTSDPMVSW